MAEFPEVCGFFGIRKIVMGNSMRKVREIEKTGVPVTNKKFGEIVGAEWKVQIAEQEKICSK